MIRAVFHYVILHRVVKACPLRYASSDTTDSIGMSLSVSFLGMYSIESVIIQRLFDCTLPTWPTVDSSSTLGSEVLVHNLGRAKIRFSSEPSVISIFSRTYFYIYTRPTTRRRVEVWKYTKVGFSSESSGTSLYFAESKGSSLEEYCARSTTHLISLFRCIL